MNKNINELTIKNNEYKSLLDDLIAFIAHGQQSAQKAVNTIRLNTYWQMGERMALAQDQLSPADAEIFVARIAADLPADKTLLYRILQFYRLWPKGIPTVSENSLSWTHHIELLALKDETERNFYLETATNENWDRNTLRKAIRKDYFTIVQQRVEDDEAPVLKRDPNPLHVYKAILENVVDGDTLLVRIDLGFEVWVNQRIRLRGINTEELTKNGRPAKSSDRAARAKAFVAEKLQDIPFIVVKTYKSDSYGRYIGDLFYHPTIAKKEDVATKGFFLNQEILKAGLAKIYE